MRRFIHKLNTQRCLAAISAALLSLHAQAALYRCTSPFAEGLVVTNIVNEAAANERGCEPLQQRRSVLDGPAPSRHSTDPRGSTNPAPTANGDAARLSDARIAPRRAAGSKHPSATAAADTGTLKAEVKRVDTAQQRSRDADRKRILQAELEAELQAQQSLQAKPFAAAAQRDEHGARAQRHAANIDALRRELSRVP